MTTDKLDKMTDGLHTITAIQIAENQTVSVTEFSGTAPTSQTADVPSLNSPAVQLTVNTAPPQFTSTPVGQAAVGTSYGYQVQAADATAVSYRLRPRRRMTINSASGLIAWTPTAAELGSDNVTVKATDQAGDGWSSLHRLFGTLKLSRGNSVMETKDGSLVRWVRQP